MRMDRYDEDELNGVKQTRTNKNQELYTDVYLNNAYVDINNLKEVLEPVEESNKEELKIDKPEVVAYSYVDKNYDIRKIIDEAIQNKEDDNIKRSLDTDPNIDNIIETINENQKIKEKDDNLLGELLPDSNNTTVVMPLDKPILDTSLIDTSVIHKNEMSNDLLDIDIKPQKKEIKQEENDEIDDSFKDETKFNKKIIIIIIGVILLIAIIIGILIWKKVIKL